MSKDPKHKHEPGMGGDCVTCHPNLVQVQKKRRNRKKGGTPASPKPMRWRSLHHHSTFSFLDGYQMPKAHVERAAQIGMQALALTEHGNVSSHVKLEQAAQDAGVQPIYGVELYCGDVEEDKRTQRKNHLTILAENQDGYVNLLRTVTQSWKDTYYEPTTSGATLRKHKKGLIILSGCTGSLLATSLVGGKNVEPEDASYSRGLRVARRFHRTFGDSFYLEVQAFPELTDVCKINKMMVRIHEETGIPMVATGDCHYTDPSESEVQQILHNIRGGTRQTLEQQAQSWGYDVPLAPATSDKEIWKRLQATGIPKDLARDAILATEEIAERCAGVVLPKASPLRFPLPEGKSRDSYWKALLLQGWHYRKLGKLPPAKRKQYKDRLARELDVIETKDYQDYFMIVSDLVIFAKDTGIPVGPARGSAAASLVCWLLRITEVDPVYFSHLVFERFIDYSRQDLPDIDLDFDSERRHEIKEYAERKYGKANVGLIGTFTMFKSKNSLDDVGRVYRIPQFEIDKIKDVLIERSSGDLRPSQTIEDTLEQFEHASAVLERYPDLQHAMDLEGNVKGLGAHAGGLIISNDPISNVAAVLRKKVANDEKADVIGWDKYDVERQGLIKIDVLGLSTMTMIAKALSLLGMNLEELYDITLEDDKVVAGFHSADVVGIFQFDGRAMRNVTRELKPDSFAEVADICALARPGPLHNGATSAYIDVKHRRRSPEPIHPILDNITLDTHYQIVYQEQILRIVREIGDFDWTEAAYIRKIISKKLGEQEFLRQFGRFWKGAKTKGMDKEMAQDIWNRCITAGSYAFNAAHSVSYGMLAWWTMWLKVYHPEVFYVSALSKLPEKKHPDLLKDAHRHKIKALVPHPSKSGQSWTLAKKGRIRGGFVQVKGVGNKLAPRMIEHRDQNPVKSWDDFLEVPGFGPAKVNGYKEFAKTDDPYRIHWLRRRVQEVRDNAESMGLPEITHWADDVPYAATGENVAVVWAGIIQHRNLRDLFELHYSRTGEELDAADVRDPHLREWVVMTGTDDTDFMTVTFSRWMYPRYKRAIWNIALDHDVVIIRGTKLGNQARRAIYVDSMWVIDPEG